MFRIFPISREPNTHSDHLALFSIQKIVGVVTTALVTTLAIVAGILIAYHIAGWLALFITSGVIALSGAAIALFLQHAMAKASEKIDNDSVTLEEGMADAVEVHSEPANSPKAAAGPPQAQPDATTPQKPADSPSPSAKSMLRSMEAHLTTKAPARVTAASQQHDTEPPPSERQGTAPAALLASGTSSLMFSGAGLSGGAVPVNPFDVHPPSPKTPSQ